MSPSARLLVNGIDWMRTHAAFAVRLIDDSELCGANKDSGRSTFHMLDLRFCASNRAEFARQALFRQRSLSRLHRRPPSFFFVPDEVRVHILVTSKKMHWTWSSFTAKITVFFPKDPLAP